MVAVACYYHLLSVAAGHRYKCDIHHHIVNIVAFAFGTFVPRERLRHCCCCAGRLGTEQADCATTQWLLRYNPTNRS